MGEGRRGGEEGGRRGKGYAVKRGRERRGGRMDNNSRTNWSKAIFDTRSVINYVQVFAIV